MPAVEQTVERVKEIDVDKYKYGFSTDIESVRAPKGLSEDIVRFISAKKGEPGWLLDWRLEAYRRWRTMQEPEEAAAIDLSKRVKHISEFLVERGMSSAIMPSARVSADGKLEKVTYHSSCHLRAAGVSKAPRDLLASVADLEFVEMQDADRCAGGAGTYIVKNYETSQKIFQRKKRAIQESGAQVVATSCPACMIQLKNGLRGIAEVKHIAQVMREHPLRK